MGLDQLPAWFLRLGAPVFTEELTRLFCRSLTEGVVPNQWKRAYIKPIQKIPVPMAPGDYRPISITPILSRLMEKLVVRTFFYPAISDPPAPLSFTDQYAFRPAGSTTAALIALLQCITEILRTNPFVIVIALDFSKAFDTVRHATLMEKLAKLGLPDHVCI